MSSDPGRGRSSADPIERDRLWRLVRLFAVLLVVDLVVMLVLGAAWNGLGGVVAVVLLGGIVSFLVVLVGFELVDLL